MTSDNLNCLWVPVQIPPLFWASVSYLQHRGSRTRGSPGFTPALTGEDAPLFPHGGSVCVSQPRVGRLHQVGGVPSDERDWWHIPSDPSSPNHRLPRAHTPLSWHRAPLKLPPSHPVTGPSQLPQRAEYPLRRIAPNSHNSPAKKILLPCFTYGATEARLGQGPYSVNDTLDTHIWPDPKLPQLLGAKTSFLDHCQCSDQGTRLAWEPVQALPSTDYRGHATQQSSWDSPGSRMAQAQPQSHH